MLPFGGIRLEIGLLSKNAKTPTGSKRKQRNARLFHTESGPVEARKADTG